MKLGYRWTEVGLIPEDWDVVPLEKVARVERGRFTARPRNDPRYYGGDIPFIQTGDVTNSNGVITGFSQTLNSEGLRVSKLFPRGTLFLTIAANIGDVGVADFDTACPDSLVAIAPRDGVDKTWLRYELASHKSAFEGIASYNAQLNINLAKLRPHLLPLPSCEEQNAIATALSDTDALLAMLDRLVAKKRDIKQAVMLEVLTGRIRLPGFDGAWHTVKIRELCEYETGLATTGGEHRYLEIGDVDVESKGYDVGGKDKPAVRGAAKVPRGTLLISTVRPTRGAITVTREEIYVSSAFCRLRPANGLLFHLVGQPGFLAYLGENSYGGAYPTCKDETILDYECLVPSDPAEQRAIAEMLSDMDAELSALEARREKTRDLKQAMMQELLTGGIRLVAAGGIDD
ncbi:MAG: restriction endonuclease subunit S [Dehalococcoidia bacterium]